MFWSMIKVCFFGFNFFVKSLGDGLWIAKNCNLCLSSQIGMVWACVRFDDYYVTWESVMWEMRENKKRELMKKCKREKGK